MNARSLFSFPAHQNSIPTKAMHSLNTAPLDRQSTIDAAIEHSGAGFAPSLMFKISSARTEAGLQLILQYISAEFTAEGRFLINRKDSSWQTFEGSAADQLAALEFDSINALSHPLNYASLREILELKIHSERLLLINGLLTKYNLPRSPSVQMPLQGWELKGALESSLEDLKCLSLKPTGTRFDLYEGLTLLSAPEGRERLIEARALGLGTIALIEATQYPLSQLTALREGLSQRLQNSSVILRLAENGYDAASLKKWGASIAQAHTLAAIEAVPGKPSHVKSMISRGAVANLEEAGAALRAGFTKGGDYKLLRTVLGQDATLETLLQAKNILPVHVIAEWANANRNRLTIDEIKAIATLTKARLNTPALVVREYRGMHPQAALDASETISPLRIYADLAAAGVTGSRLRVLTRAGIQVTEAVAHKDSVTEWADGAMYREAYAARQASMVASGWASSVEPWAFDETTFRQGYEQV